MNNITNKEKYKRFVNEVYVPIFSMPWWMDAVCGENNWDVWIYEKGDCIVAAMPYFMEKRGDYLYITKALLTQNNGLIINYPSNQSALKRAKFEEKIIDELIFFLKSSGIDVYEQQYHHSFKNFLPFYWEGFEIIPRITYVLNKDIGVEKLDNIISSNYRNKMRKGERSIECFSTIDENTFYEEHEKIFKRQGLDCPFSFAVWKKLYNACQEHGCGEIVVALGGDDEIFSLAYIVSDNNTSYLLLGGEIPKYSTLQTFPRLVKECIINAFQSKRDFDFEGSVIKRINHSFREYGGEAKEYYRIRKVFNPNIINIKSDNQLNK